VDFTQGGDGQLASLMYCLGKEAQLLLPASLLLRHLKLTPLPTITQRLNLDGSSIGKTRARFEQFDVRAKRKSLSLTCFRIQVVLDYMSATQKVTLLQILWRVIGE
jgi:hypothetical protein